MSRKRSGRAIGQSRRLNHANRSALKASPGLRRRRITLPLVGVSPRSSDLKSTAFGFVMHAGADGSILRYPLCPPLRSARNSKN